MLLLVAACGRVRELPLGTNSFSSTLAAVEEALGDDEVELALERARTFERRFPGEVASGLLGEALWRTGRLNEAEGHLRRAAEQGNRHGMLGLARVAISRGRWEAARDWARRADAGVATEELLFAVARATGDDPAAREAATALAETTAGDALAEARAMRASVDAGSWRGGPGAVTLARTAGGEWLLPVELEDRPLRMRLALDEPRSWIRAAALRDGGVLFPAGEGADGEPASLPTTVVVGPLRLAGLERGGVPLQVRPGATEGSDGAIGADLLADLHWSLDPVAARLAVAVARGAAGEAASVAGPEAAEMLRPPGGQDVLWLGARVLRQGLDVQWLLMPRIEARVMAAAVAPTGPGTIDAAAVEDLGLASQGGPTVLEVRLGDWWSSVSWRVEDLSSRAAGGRVAPRLLLGRESLRRWRLLWDPGTRQLALVPLAGERSGASRRGGLQ